MSSLLQMPSGPIALFVVNLDKSDKTSALSETNNSLGMTSAEDSTGFKGSKCSVMLTKKSLILDARSAASEMPSLRN